MRGALIRGRMHGVRGVRGSFLSPDSVESAAEERTRRSGVAPVMERSGQSCWVRWRYFCPKFLRQTFHEYAGESIRHSFWARAYYESQRAKGKSHHAAARALSFKWVRIIFRCWQTRTAYDEVKYLESLRRKGSP